MTIFSISINMYDPGKWKNIDSNLRDLLVEKGQTRESDINFPKDENSRHFSTSYYTRKLSNGEKYDRRWLIYSKYFDKVYCFCCKLFSTKSSVTQLGNEGTIDWKNLGTKLKIHETSNEHIMNMSTWTIDREVQHIINKEKKHWRNVLVRIIVIMKSLAKNNLAFRGDNEKIYQENNGNILCLIEMIFEFDPIMQEHVKNAILKKIKVAKYFSIMLDGTPDISHQEKMYLIIRCVTVSTSPVRIKEYFLGFLNVDDTSGAGLFRKHQGVQKRLLEIDPRALYTPCGCHSLNLGIYDVVTSCVRTISFFGVLQCIYSLFISSPKRWKILKNNISSLTVKLLSQTCWESRIESVKAIRFQSPNIRDALLE
ncbi:hypothetical protein UlMin_035056 [Ulmus minor]